MDVVVPVHPKDLSTLEPTIARARRFAAGTGTGTGVGRVFVISSTRVTDAAIHVPESGFPFTTEEVRAARAPRPAHCSENEHCWYFQQLLKLHVHLVVPDLSPRFLVLDAETLLGKPVAFFDDDGTALIAPSPELCPEHRRHAHDLLAPEDLLYPPRGGLVSHHMPMRTDVLRDLHATVTARTGLPFWRAFMAACRHVPGAASEYELVGGFMLARGTARIRPLAWDLATRVPADGDDLGGLDFVTAHAHLRAA